MGEKTHGLCASFVVLLSNVVHESENVIVTGR